MKRIPGPSTEPKVSIECTRAVCVPSALMVCSVEMSIVGIFAIMFVVLSNLSDLSDQSDFLNMKKIIGQLPNYLFNILKT